MKDKLTWDVRFPLPYESSWSIFSRIQMLNLINPNRLFEIIRKPEIVNPWEINLRSSKWLDFKKLSELLGVDERRLREGFLDQIGFEDSITLRSHNGVRFCPECLQTGYHSVFFDLDFIDTCPIHEVELSKRCVKCENAILRYGAKYSDTQDSRAGISPFGKTSCGHVSFDLKEILEASSPLEATSVGDKIVTWWTAIRSKLPMVQQSFENWTDLTNYQKSIVSAIANIHKNNVINVFDKPSGGVDYIYAINRPPGINKMESDISALIKCYKSIRRHIYKTWINKDHKACYAEVHGLSRIERLAIPLEYVCPMSLSYVIWTAQIEREINRECIQNSYLFQLGECNFYNYAISQFYSIVGLILSSSQAGESLMLIKNQGYRLRYHGIACSDENELRGFLAFPAKDYLAGESLRTCNYRRDCSISMADDYFIDELYNWAWSSDILRDESVMFRIKTTKKTRGIRYNYIKI
ncbi:MAG: hypothetical protein CMI00_08780 [Oceanospirillaceae bacterium]|nr:hypothetical protein [Oceanospirillaceae bacterium]